MKKIKNPKWSILIIVLIMTIFLALVGVLILQIFQSIYIQSNIVYNYYKAYYISNAWIEIALTKHQVRAYQPFSDKSDYNIDINNIPYHTNITVDNLSGEICQTLEPNDSYGQVLYYYQDDENWADISKPSEKYIDMANSVSFENVNGDLQYTIWTFDNNTKELRETNATNWSDDSLFAKPITNWQNITIPSDANIHKISIANVGSSSASFCIKSDWIPSNTLSITSDWIYKDTKIILHASKTMNDL